MLYSAKLQDPASGGNQLSDWSALGLPTPEVVLQSWQLREAAASSPGSLAGVTENDCSKRPLLCLDAASLDAISSHKACGEARCGGTHSTRWDQPSSAFMH